MHIIYSNVYLIYIYIWTKRPSTNKEFVFSHQNTSRERVGNLSSWDSAGGVFGSLGTGSLLGATRAYQTILRCSIATAVLCGCLFLLMLRPDNLLGLLITVTFFGVFMMSSLPALLSNAVEETFPTPPEISTTLLFNSAILLQVFFTPLAQFILNQDDGCSSWGSKYSTFNVYIGCFGCLLPAVLYCGKNNRMLAENQDEETFGS